MTRQLKVFLAVAWFLFFLAAILAFAAPACKILAERNQLLG